MDLQAVLNALAEKSPISQAYADLQAKLLIRAEHGESDHLQKTCAELVDKDHGKDDRDR